MAIKIDRQDKRISLELSGGGIGAAGFHLGVMTELQRLGILDKLALISCVKWWEHRRWRTGETLPGPSTSSQRSMTATTSLD